MIIYPAIDLKEGQCVRLRQGNMKEYTLYNNDPPQQAADFESAGCRWLHVVDLDGALAAKPINVQAMENIIKRVNIPVQIGGGIRTLETIRAWLDKGAQRIVLGTVAVENFELVRQAARAFPDRIVVGIDARGQKIATHGWVKNTQTTMTDLVQSLEKTGIAAIIYTDINQDGVMRGPNIKATVALAQATSIPVIASGGVASIQDLIDLRDCGVDLNGVVLGRSLYEQSIELKHALDIIQ